MPPCARQMRASVSIIVILLLCSCSTSVGLPSLSSLLGRTADSSESDSPASGAGRPQWDSHDVMHTSTLVHNGVDSGSLHLPSLLSLRASLHELTSRDSSIPSRCRAANSESTLAARCARLTQADRTYLTVAFTECHLQLYTHKYRFDSSSESCQSIEDEREMAECVKVSSSHHAVTG